MIGYKGFNGNLQCMGFQYEIGKIYEIDDFKLCHRGFHFCSKMYHVFSYYALSKHNRYAEVEAIGDAIKASDTGRKYVTNKIKIIREISYHDAIELARKELGEINI